MKKYLMNPVVVRVVVTAVAAGVWFAAGKPVDEMQLQDFIGMLVGLLVGKEALKRTGD